MCLTKPDRNSQVQNDGSKMKSCLNNGTDIDSMPLVKKRLERDVVLNQFYKDVNATIRQAHMLMGGIELNLNNLGTHGLLSYSYTFLHRFLVDPLQVECPDRDEKEHKNESINSPAVKRLRWSDGHLAQEGADFEDVIEDEGASPSITHHHMYILRQYSYHLHIMEHKLKNMSNLCHIYQRDMDTLLAARQELQSILNRIVETEASRRLFFEKFSFELSIFLSKSPTLTPHRACKTLRKRLKKHRVTLPRKRKLKDSSLNAPIITTKRPRDASPLKG